MERSEKLQHQTSTLQKWVEIMRKMSDNWVETPSNRSRRHLATLILLFFHLVAISSNVQCSFSFWTSPTRRTTTTLRWPRVTSGNEMSISSDEKTFLSINQHVECDAAMLCKNSPSHRISSWIECELDKRRWIRELNDHANEKINLKSPSLIESKIEKIAFSFFQPSNKELSAGCVKNQ